MKYYTHLSSTKRIVPRAAVVVGSEPTDAMGQGVEPQPPAVVDLTTDEEEDIDDLAAELKFPVESTNLHGTFLLENNGKQLAYYDHPVDGNLGAVIEFIERCLSQIPTITHLDLEFDNLGHSDWQQVGRLAKVSANINLWFPQNNGYAKSCANTFKLRFDQTKPYRAAVFVGRLEDTMVTPEQRLHQAIEHCNRQMPALFEDGTPAFSATTPMHELEEQQREVEAMLDAAIQRFYEESQPSCGIRPNVLAALLDHMQKVGLSDMTINARMVEYFRPICTGLRNVPECFSAKHGLDEAILLSFLGIHAKHNADIEEIYTLMKESGPRYEMFKRTHGLTDDKVWEPAAMLHFFNQLQLTPTYSTTATGATFRIPKESYAIVTKLAFCIMCIVVSKM